MQEVAKQAVFSILGEKIENTMCLDLFAGSGNIGLEALSRGAKHCDFVDEDTQATRTIEENIKKCGFEEQSEVFRSNAVKFVANTIEKYNIIFLDPFYDDTSHVFLMKNIEEILDENGTVIFFHGEKLDINKIIKDTELKTVDHRRFGKSYFSILNK